MGLQDTRTVIKTGNSKAITIPAKLKTGEKASLAANRLILLDPRGEIAPSALLEFLERFIEPYIWGWLREKHDEKQSRHG